MTTDVQISNPADILAEQERGNFVDKKTPKSPGQKIIIIIIAILAICVIAYAVLKLNGVFSKENKQAVKVEEQKRPESTPDFDVSLTEPPKSEPKFVECAGGLRLPEGMTCPSASTPKSTEEHNDTTAKGPTEEEILQKRRFSSDISVATGKDPKAEGSGDGNSDRDALTGETTLGNALIGTATVKTSASMIKNPSFTLAKGTLPDCTLLTAISTDQPGFLKCILSKPVYSMDGAVVLMEPGTEFDGEYSAGMARGKKRMFAIWDRAVTPNHVVVTLNSPSTDPLGRSGMDGQLDQHFLERFGGALLYSLFSDSLEYMESREEQRSQERMAQNAANGNGSSFYYNQNSPMDNLTRTRSTADRIVDAMLNQGQDIQPTLYKNQGEIIKIYVARDVDFSSVYKLTRNPRS